MESTSCSLLKGSLDIQANAVAALLAGGAQNPQTPPLQSPQADNANRAAGLQAEGIGQKLDTTC